MVDCAGYSMQTGNIRRQVPCYIAGLTLMTPPHLTSEPGRELRLLDHTAGNPCSATAQWSRLICIIVTTRMDHERAALHVRHL